MILGSSFITLFIYGVIALQISYQMASFFITILASSGILGGILLMAISDYICRKKSLIVIQIIVALSFLFIIFGGKHIQLLMVGVGCF